MTTPTALVVDDEPDILDLLELTLSRMGIAVSTCENLASARKLLQSQNYNLCFTDMLLGDGNGLDLVDFIQLHCPQTPVAVITAHGNVEAAIRALKSGAFDFLSKPVDLNHLRKLVSDALKLEDFPVVDRRSRHVLLGDSKAMCEIRGMIAKVSRSQAPVYISGESGTGKELVARLIHEKSARRGKPFIAVNCGAIPDELAESEFFGHKKGSFSGAISDKDGLFQAAAGGTVFLDEVADLPLNLQVKLLRTLQEKQIRKIGDTRETDIDVRILTATHKNLAQQVADKQFREDLFYRINVIELHVPPLRERKEDISQLTNHIIQRLAQQSGSRPTHLSADAMQALENYSFPGNVRELENLLERAVTLCEDGVIETDDLNLPLPTPVKLNAADLNHATQQPQPSQRPDNVSLESFMDEIEKNTILQALEKNRWNKTATARYLGITFRALRYRLKKLEVE